MSAQRQPQPTDLLAASDIAEMYGWPTPRAEALLKSIARQDKTWVKWEGYRRLFITRASLEARMRKGAGVQ